MPIRDKFPKKYFDGNPYEGETPEEMYRRLRWGNEPTETFDLEMPESMVSLGEVAMVVLDGKSTKFLEHEAPYMAIGAASNQIYIVPKDDNGQPVDVPVGPYVEIGTIRQIDYYSDKGGTDAYYYHEHEEPFPKVYMHMESGVCVVEPAEMEDGSRSYAVGDEGVIG